MKRVWIAAFLFWVVASALACGLYPVQIADACNRYAPMADAFARGDFRMAFHPRFGVLFMALAGIFTWLTGLAGIYTVQIASFLLLALAGVVVFALARRLSGSDSVAWWSFAMAMLVPNYYVYALDGLREPAMCLAFALLGLGVVSRCSWLFALGLLVDMLTFAHGYFTSSLFLGLWCLRALYERKVRAGLLPVAAWAVGTGVLMAMVHAQTGYWVPVLQVVDAAGRWL